MKKFLYLLLLGVLPYSTSITLSAQNGVHNGHSYVDLGLPDGTKWATCNVGASEPEQFGNKFAWGQISTKTSYSKSNYPWRNLWNAGGFYKNNIDNYDTARRLWGGWCMPLDNDFYMLFRHTTHEWTTVNGVKGIRLTGKNGNSIFFPAAGYSNGEEFIRSGHGHYWTRSLYANWTDCPSSAYFNSYGGHVSDRYPPYYHLSVRPVLH